MKKITTIGIITLLTIGLSGCSWFQSEEPIEPVAETPTDVTEPVEESAVTEYIPSEELSSKLDQAQDELRMSLFRGDAELAPTYKEFITNVNKAQDILEEAINLYKEESKGKKVSDSLSNVLKTLELTNDKLQMSLFRGDAEYAPTQEEFNATVGDINEELTKYMNNYRAL